MKLVSGKVVIIIIICTTVTFNGIIIILKD